MDLFSLLNTSFSCCPIGDCQAASALMSCLKSFAFSTSMETPVEEILQMVKSSRIPGSGIRLTWLTCLPLPHTTLEVKK